MIKQLRLAALFCICLACAACAPGSGSAAGGGVSSGIVSEESTVKAAQPKQEEPVEAPELLRARELLAGMSMEEKAAQMFIARCPETEAAALAARLQPGGYILFGRDFKDKTREEITANIESYQAASKIPMLIGVDEEGGEVNRVSQNPALRARPFASPQALFRAGGMERVTEDAEEKCALLKSLGINVNFAPVCDLSTDPADYIYSRSFGKDAKTTAEYIGAVVGVMEEQSVGSVLKHFPGYGNNNDTHKGMARDKREYAAFETGDFVPFRAGIAAGAGAVLVSHNIVESMDAASPASLSLKVHKILRDELGFKGVIVTDDLSMEAILDDSDVQSAAVKAVNAGNDLLCCTNFEEQLAAVVEAVKAGTITEERIEESVLRVLLWKLRLGAIT